MWLIFAFFFFFFKSSEYPSEFFGQFGPNPVWEYSSFYLGNGLTGKYMSPGENAQKEIAGMLTDEN